LTSGLHLLLDVFIHRKRKLDRGEPSEGITMERTARLTAIGFLRATRAI
jgi:hypothetical protein